MVMRFFFFFFFVYMRAFEKTKIKYIARTQFF